jgi:hypothetical protein
VYTVKVEVADQGGEMLAAIHGDVHALEFAPQATVAWYFNPMLRGKDLELYSDKEEDAAAGMAGRIEVSGPPPFTGN